MEPLFSNLFPDADKNAWLVQVQKELKSDSVYESLRWPTDEGFTLELYYTANDLAQLPLKTIQSAQKQTPGWLNVPEYTLTNDAKADNSLLRNALVNGADGLVLSLSAETDLTQLLNGIKLSDTPIYFRLAASIDPVDFIRRLKTIAPYQLKGGLLTDPGDVSAEVRRLTADSPQFRTIYVSSHAFHNAGGTIIQELAFTLASLVGVYDRLTDEGLTIDQLVPKTAISLSVGTSYFLEIAKLRALRVLLDRIFKAYHSLFIIHPHRRTDPLFIHAQTSTFYDATATPYTNLLRATTEAMAAVIGGCDALTIHPYNTVLGQPANDSNQEHADRIARNVSILLKSESYLDKVADPSAGAYYIENLTHQFIESAWTLFLDVEGMGGYKQAFADGFIRSVIEQSYHQKIEAVKAGKVIVGVTKFRSDEGESSTSETVRLVNDTSLPDQRLAQAFE
jgi:methylmalonyl-CoA mutase